MNIDKKWQIRFYQMAMLVSTWSKDPKNKTGAVIVTEDCRNISVGYNGFPRGVQDVEGRLNNKEWRQVFTVHAELNAIYNARFDLRGCTIYSTKYPCSECAQGIIQVGVKRVVSPPASIEGTWATSQQYAGVMFRETDTEIVDYMDLFNNGNTI